MKRHQIFLISLCLTSATMLVPLQASAANKYVSDQLRITMRTGQGNQFQIMKALVSGMKLEVLEETDTGYTKVKTEDGQEGWVRTQYLSDEPIAADKLVRAESRLEKTKERNKALKEELSTLRKDKVKLDSEHAALQSQHTSASKELTHLSKVAARPKQLAKENIDLHKKYEQISDELILVKQENQVLKDRSQRHWFITGAGVLIIGMLIGLIIPKFRFKSKDSWSSY